ncbi:MAG: galactose mutarotase [Muribaculaceae bacterium]|nr:galactose mutarotase [Muribaculaceae bacterium]
MIKINSYDVTTPHGVVTLYTLTNSTGASVELQSLGAGVRSICVPDDNGIISNVAIGYADLADYYADGPCAGKTPGRYANRIGEGKFSIEGQRYQLRINNGPNALHGGPEGFANKIWQSYTCGDSVIFTLFSPSGDENYPGNMIVSVIYTWSEDNQLTIKYQAVADEPTVINLTNHTYFNLRGENTGADALKSHLLQIFASHYLPTNDSLVPTGVIAPIAGTPMDFTKPKAIGKDLFADFPALNIGKGYDACWVIDEWNNDSQLKEAVVLTDEKSGRKLSVYTTQPAVQIYTGNWLEGAPKSISGGLYHDYDAVAIECQGMPDAPNKPNFPSQLLLPGKVYNQTIKYIFSTL